MISPIYNYVPGYETQINFPVLPVTDLTEPVIPTDLAIPAAYDPGYVAPVKEINWLLIAGIGFGIWLLLRRK